MGVHEIHEIYEIQEIHKKNMKYIKYMKLRKNREYMEIVLSWTRMNLFALRTQLCTYVLVFFRYYDDF